MPAPDWAPSVAQVAAILRARTRGPGSRDAVSAMEQGTFTESTRPTADQVTGLIETACGDVQLEFPGREPCTPQLASSATTAATYRAAQLVEVSYFPEATRGEGSAFESLEKLAERAMTKVGAAIVAGCPLVGDAPDDDGGVLAPAGRGPCRPLIGLETVW